MAALGQLQEEFAICEANLVVWIYSQGWAVRRGWAYRPPWAAKILAEQGKGIINSVHTKKLASDLYLTKGGQVTWDVDDYRPIGEYWKTLHPLARWGGDFKNRDAVHFSFEYKGVK